MREYDDGLKKFICVVCVLTMIFTAGGCGRKQQSPVLRVAIPYSDYVQEPETDFYLSWLQEKTGIELEVITIRQNRSTEYLDSLFSSGADVDIVMFGGDFTINEEEVLRYYEEGHVWCGDAAPAEKGESPDSEKPGVVQDGSADTDSMIYYPNYGYGEDAEVGQILWINYEWLSALGLSVPRTTGELEEVLLAFKTRDPNGNGLADEIPLAGTTENYIFSPQELVLNSFVCNDPFHGRFEKTAKEGPVGAESLHNEAVEGENTEDGGSITDAEEADEGEAGPEESGSTAMAEEVGSVDERCVCVTEEFREGLRFLRKLYGEGLMDAEIFSDSVSRFIELVNSPVDLVGAFTTDSISDVIYPGNPEIMARYIHVPPLAGPEGVRHALCRENKPAVGAIITAQSGKKEAAKRFLDMMMTPEASLIARFGEEGVDWEFSGGTDVNAYGSASSIVTKNYIWNTLQNKHLNGIGPLGRLDLYPEGVTWNGLNSDTEYIDARARTSYREWLSTETATYTPDREYADYVDSAIRDFVTGVRDIDSDEAWRKYVEEVARMM